ncbi:hypothetical protein FPQ18DRAFT_326940 [Pyronema domesticum]|uniref:Uncharacterized protein n=1 Tax=Pyronema omphalodes (strain CBS 100304) TaxID=1076935 RepID=U4L674_PYROM|nr:hypothetical protein FPQ18DRAFT_326940 [Pyronema domesticum]CCX05525.1 Similar to hypothetical protein AOL_s00081g104 [Arthrobotrys oligospora ATCC 24927]; acc. no. EGX48108 [Pyronema omphalodes CBS 100304]
MRLAGDNKLHAAPLDAPQRILDIGTDTGIWARDIADKYPMADPITQISCTLHYLVA